MSSFEVSDGRRLLREQGAFADDAVAGYSALREDDPSANAEIFESASDGLGGSAGLHAVSESLGAAYALLESARHGIVLIDSEARVCFANGEARKIAARSDSLTVENGRLRFLQRVVQIKFEAYIGADIERPKQSPSIGEFAASLPRSSGARPYVLVVKRVAAERLLFGCHVYDFELQRTATDVGLLRHVYGLTPAEADVAIHLFHVGSVEQVARALGIRESTVRAHLTKVLRKCEVRSIAMLLQHLALGPLANLRAEYRPL